MSTFSQRMGLESIREGLQLEQMDDALRNSIWNEMERWTWGNRAFQTQYLLFSEKLLDEFGRRFFADFLKQPADERSKIKDELVGQMREVYFGLPWNKVYDFIEFAVRAVGEEGLARSLNGVLEREQSGYRIIEGIVTPVTDALEMREIRTALDDPNFAGVNEHLKTALARLSDRDQPDYRNSIKESISALESALKQLTDDDRVPFAAALSKLEREGNLHGALKKGFNALYGYTSDGDGIRHALLDEPKLTAADAQYFLVSCSSFINYLKAKLSTVE